MTAKPEPKPQAVVANELDWKDAITLRQAYERGKRDGAREALERSEKRLRWLADDPERRRMYVAYGARALACYIVDAVDAIRALAEPTPAKPEVKRDSWTQAPHAFIEDENNANTCARCYHGILDPRHSEPRPAPSKTEELLDHPFSPCDCEDQRHCTTIVETAIRFPGAHNCGEPEAAHRRK